MNNKKDNLSKPIVRIIFELILFVGSLVIIAPLWMIFTNSLKNQRYANLLGMSLPTQIVFKNYVIVFAQGNLLRSLFNGIFMSSISTALLILIASMAAFVISRRKSKITESFYMFFVAGLVFPGALIPTFWVLHNLKMINTYHGMILIYTTLGIPLGIFLYAGFIKLMPNELDEAAITDGCGRIRLFFRIIFPLLKPVTMTILVFHFLGVWNDVQYQLFFASNRMWTMPMTVYKFYGMYSYQWNLVFADIIITILPVLAVYLMAQRYVVSGLTAGAIKG